MGEIAVNQNSTIVLPVPIDLLRPYLDAANQNGSSQVRPEEHQDTERLYKEAVGSAAAETPEAGPPDGGGGERLP
jgi:hypothetical protein